MLRKLIFLADRPTLSGVSQFPYRFRGFASGNSLRNLLRSRAWIAETTFEPLRVYSIRVNIEFLSFSDFSLAEGSDIYPGCEQ